MIIPKEYKGPIGKGESIFSFRNFYIEYARFHRNDANVWIHIFFIPMLVATLMGWGFYQEWGG